VTPAPAQIRLLVKVKSGYRLLYITTVVVSLSHPHSLPPPSQSVAHTANDSLVRPTAAVVSAPYIYCIIYIIYITQPPEVSNVSRYCWHRFPFITIYYSIYTIYYILLLYTIHTHACRRNLRVGGWIHPGRTYKSHPREPHSNRRAAAARCSRTMHAHVYRGTAAARLNRCVLKTSVLWRARGPTGNLANDILITRPRW